ncbi:hypothetical protein [[Kitasatospora] papulosa]|uniref:hypothetical protein n=1 Tax=[Kitasatospora] papulosa TaxID=1464011 RepID=UPI00403CA363
MPTNVCVPDNTAADSVNVSARNVPLPARRGALDASFGLRDGQCATTRNWLSPEAIMALLFFGTDPNSGGGNCPAVWVDTEAAEGPGLVLQGKFADAVTRAACSQDSPPADDEEVIRLSVRMIDQIRKACDAAEAASPQL